LTDIEIKAAADSDFDAVYEFYRELIESMQGAKYRPEWKLGVYPTETQLRDAITKRTLYAAFAGGKIIGAFIMNDRCEPGYAAVSWQACAKQSEVRIIHLLAVSRPRQGAGVAKRMLAFAAGVCAAEGVKAIRLDVLERNLPAARLYASAGFTHVETISMYYEDTGDARFLMYEMVL